MATDFYEKMRQEKQRREQIERQQLEDMMDSLPPALRPDPVLAELAAPAEELIIPEGGIKFDSGKPRYDLIPPEPLDGLANLYALGAKKYEDRNWEQGLKWSRVFSAMMRHAWKWFRGEDYDGEDGQHHLLSVIWCAMALYTYFVRGTGQDDRPPQATSPECYETVWKASPKPLGDVPLN